MKIGVFDSGIGGMTVLREFIKLMPENDYVYFGDTKRVPYGNKSFDTIKKCSMQIVDFLIAQNVDMIVIACGTVSAVALEYLKDKIDIPIIGIIEPTSQYIKNRCDIDHIGVIGTDATIKSNAWERKINENSDMHVYSKACPLFVPIVEEGNMSNHILTEIIEKYLFELKDKNIQSLVLGCTHYPIIRDDIEKYFGYKINIIDPGLETAKNVMEVTKYNTVYGRAGKTEFYLSDITETARELANKIVGTEILEIKLQELID